MGITSASDINVVDGANSTTTPLLAGETFTGVFAEVLDVTSVSVTILTDVAPAAGGTIFQWSTDGTNIDLEEVFGGSFLSLDSRIKAKFFRFKYINGVSPQSFFRVQTLLRKGTPTGTIGKAGNDISTSFDAVTTSSVMFGARNEDPSDLVILRTTNDPFLIAATPPHRTTNTTQTVTATTGSAAQLDFFGIFANTRRTFTVFNDTRRGNLYIGYSSGTTTSSFFYKVPPQHLWTMPMDWIHQSGGVWGIWDVADGFARVMETF